MCTHRRDSACVYTSNNNIVNNNINNNINNNNNTGLLFIFS